MFVLIWASGFMGRRSRRCHQVLTIKRLHFLFLGSRERYGLDGLEIGPTSVDWGSRRE